MSDALSNNPYKPSRTAVQILDGHSSKRHIPPEIKPGSFAYYMEDESDPDIVSIRFVIFVIIGCIALPFILVGYIVAFIFDNLKYLFFGPHKVSSKEKYWFEEMHRNNKDFDTEAIDKYINEETQKVVDRLQAKYPSINTSFSFRSQSGNDSDEFIISFIGMKITKVPL